MSMGRAIGISTILSSLLVSVIFGVFSFVGVTAVGNSGEVIRLTDAMVDLKNTAQKTNENFMVFMDKYSDDRLEFTRQIQSNGAMIGELNIRVKHLEGGR